MSYVSLVISLLALAVAGASAPTRSQAVAQGRATAIESDRRHDELTPLFEASCEVTGDLEDSGTLKISLAGGIDALNGVVVTIQDEYGIDHWGRGLPDGVSQETAEAFVWGPWEFDTNAGAQVVSSRQSRPRAYSLLSGKNWDVLTLAATRPGSCMTGNQPGQVAERAAGTAHPAAGHLPPRRAPAVARAARSPPGVPQARQGADAGVGGLRSRACRRRGNRGGLL